MEIQDIKINDAVNFWLVEEHAVPVIAVQIAFLGGSSQNPAGKEGAAKLLASMMLESVGDLSATEFQSKLEDLSIGLSITAGQDHTYISLTMLSHRIDEAFDLAQLALFQPGFDEDDLSRVKSQTVSELKLAKSKPGSVAGIELSKLIFKDHLYERQNKGTIESIEAITRNDLISLHQLLFNKKDIHVTVVGAISAEVAATKVKTLLAPLPADAELVEVINIRPETGQVKHIDFDVPQVTVQFALPGIAHDDPDYHTAVLVNHILGGGSFSSRLYKEVREKHGLAYSVGTSLMNYDHSAVLYGSTATETSRAQKAIDVIRGEIEKMANKGSSEEELRQAKDYLIGSYPLRFDSSRKIARQLLSMQMNNLGKNYIETRADMIEAVTLEDVRRVAKNMLDVEPSIVTVGQSF